MAGLCAMCAIVWCLGHESKIRFQFGSWENSVKPYTSNGQSANVFWWLILAWKLRGAAKYMFVWPCPLTQAQDQGHIFSLNFRAGFDFNNTFIQDLSVSINYWIWYTLKTDRGVRRSRKFRKKSNGRGREFFLNVYQRVFWVSGFYSAWAGQFCWQLLDFFWRIISFPKCPVLLW